MRLLSAPLSTAIAISSGLILLLSLIIPEWRVFGARITGWAVLLAAIALLLGLANLIQVHVKKIQKRDQPLHSSVLLFSLIAAFGFTLLGGRNGEAAKWLFSYLIVPLESSFLGLLAITLVVALIRLIEGRKDWAGLLFATSVLLILMGSGPIFSVEIPIFTQVVTPFIQKVLALGGLRGLIIGVALGTLASAIRILIGSDRPYGA